jgi:hypothetical protein
MLNNIAALVGAATPEVGDYESISTVTLGSSQATVTFSSIPSTYKHLQIRGIAKSTTVNHLDMQFNSDTGNNYAGHQLEGNGTAASASAGATRANIFSVVMMAGTSPIMGAGIIDILDYANTNKYKTARSLRGYDANGSGNISLISGLWMNTAAISTITLTARGGSVDQYTTFALYGIK